MTATTRPTTSKATFFFDHRRRRSRLRSVPSVSVVVGDRRMVVSVAMVELAPFGQGKHQSRPRQQRQDENRADRRGVAVLTEEERLLVDVEDEHRGRPRRAPGGHDEHQVQAAGDDGHGGHDEDEEAGGPQQGEGDGAEALPRSSAVDSGGLIVLGRDVLQPGQEDDHVVAYLEPHSRSYTYDQHEVDIAEQRDVLQPQRTENPAEDPDAVGDHDLPHHADDDQADHVRHEQRAADQPDERDLLLHQQRQPEAGDEDRRHHAEQVEQGDPYAVPE